MSMLPGVAAGHPTTARAGAEILHAGGSAADAAVAMMLVSCAAETIFTGLSGGGFAIYYDAASRQATCLNFFVQIPGTTGRARGDGVPIEVIFVGQQVPYDIGPSTVAVPGVPAGAKRIWERWGRLAWADVVAPGLAASYGTPFSQAHADLLPLVSQAMHVGDGDWVYRRPDGAFLQAGDVLVHEDQHLAYRLLAQDPDAFYHGAFAHAMVEAVADGGALDLADLETYEVVESEPRVVSWRGTQVAARGDDLDDLLGTLAEVRSGGTDVRSDPDLARSLVTALRAPDRRAETTNCVAVDADGNACAITTTLGLGSGVWVPGYGVHLNSMLGEGELIRGELVPGQRMGSMMSPLLVFADGEPVIVAGAAGGSRIRPALIQCLLGMVGGLPPQQAIDAPRLNAVPGLVRLEPGFSEAVVGALRQQGDEVAIADTLAPYFGGVSAISTLGGGADVRRGGTVIVV
ncbi:gamma-glutamyltransferase [Microlunatus ginsengisoli]|uniref:Gamma-glutamyltranspeptidase / glutathione hydrolase n=1 Tax=Microlunatus ginsengisoli TaxID=363863 RepID=A0ABP6ZT93_9ACTN